jgi:WD40 repeat protein
MQIETRELILDLRYHSASGITALDRTGQLHRFDNGKPVVSHSVGRVGVTGRISIDGSRIAVWHEESKIEIFSAMDGRKLGESPALTGTVCGAAFSPDGTQLLYATTDGMVHSWSVAAARMNWRMKTGLGEVVGIAYSPNSAHFFATNMDANVRQHSVRNGEIEAINEQLPISFFDCVYSPDGASIAAGGAARQVHVFNAAGLKLERSFRRETDPIARTVMSKDGQFLAVALFQELSYRNPTYIVVYDFATGNVLKEITTRGSAAGLSLAPGARRLAWSVGPSGISTADF